MIYFDWVVYHYVMQSFRARCDSGEQDGGFFFYRPDQNITGTMHEPFRLGLNESTSGSTNILHKDPYVISEIESNVGMRFPLSLELQGRLKVAK